MATPQLTADEEVRLARRIEAGLLAQDLLDQFQEGDCPSLPYSQGELLQTSPWSTVSLASAVGTCSHRSQPASLYTTAELMAVAREGVEAQQALIESTLGLLRVISLELARRSGRGRQDLFQQGYLLLYEAMMRYDYRQGRFAPYAASCLRYGLRQTSGSETVLPEHLTDERPEQAIEAYLTRYSLGQLLRRLPAAEAEVLRRHHGLDGPPVSLSQTARQLGCTLSQVRRLEQQALKHLRHDWLAAEHC